MNDMLEKNSKEAMISRLMEKLPRKWSDKERGFANALIEIAYERGRLFGEVAMVDIEEAMIADRDRAEDAADALASKILDEPINWPDHDDAWQRAMEAIDYIKNSMPDVSIAGLTVVDLVPARKGGEQ